MGPTEPPIQCVLGAFTSGQGMWVLKLTTHLHLMPRQKMDGPTPSFPYTSLWCDTLLSTTVTFSFTYEVEVFGKLMGTTEITSSSRQNS
jgi:hypothetical protein